MTEPLGTCNFTSHPHERDSWPLHRECHNWRSLTTEPEPDTDMCVARGVKCPDWLACADADRCIVLTPDPTLGTCDKAGARVHERWPSCRNWKPLTVEPGRTSPVEAVVRMLIESGDITPTGARMMRRVLSNE